ncbi:MAG: polysaccharide pyruvyl transferase family protein [Pirellulales bacterium]|nr:polysaccharide pyruvyl transferase family protein [Pirellulales bacterium]
MTTDRNEAEHLSPAGRSAGGDAQPLLQDSVPSITLIDPSVAASNLGDFIIMEAVRRELAELLARLRCFTVASHERMTRFSRGLIRQSAVAIVGGTNLLSSRMWFRCPWKLTPLDGLLCRRIVLMGCGWYQFQRRPDPYSRWLLRSILSATHVHSVRDSYTLARLRSIGITNALNTGCPTLWSLDPERLRTIPVEQGHAVLTALNTYFPNRRLDGELLQLLCRAYRKVYLWPQNPADYPYVRQFGLRIHYVDPTLQALDELLVREAGIDYVGNRLHAGIRALQHGVRSLIVEVDNRAQMMGADFGLPTAARADLAGIARWIERSPPLALRLPRAAIDEWKQRLWASLGIVEPAGGAVARAYQPAARRAECGSHDC